MKFFSVTAFLRSRYPLAIVAGLLLASAFPNWSFAGAAWIAPAFLLALGLGRSAGESFRIGYVAGLAHYMASLYWLLLIPVRGFPILAWLALSAFLALCPAAWLWLSARLARLPRMPEPAAFPAVLRQLHRQTWTDRLTLALLCATLWVGLEMLVARVFGGFPWNLLGASQYQLIPLVQIASITGVYGVSFLVVWTSVSLLHALAAVIARPQFRSGWMAELLPALAAIAATFAFGFHHLRHAPAAGNTLKVALVQPSIPQTLIWNPEGDLERFRELMALSQEALTNDVDLLIWPEAAIPGLLRYHRDVREPILGLARSNRVWMIVGADDAEPIRETPDPEDAEIYNASFLISPLGELGPCYRKRNLVIFGEYIPLERWLPIVKWLTPVTGSFTPGTAVVPFEMEFNRDRTGGGRPDARVKTSALICFEDNFPHLVREYADEETDFLVNLTNNGWFGESAAQWQHAANAVFRSIENGLPLVRCTNNGLTCWVDSRGRLRDIFRDAGGGVYGAGYLLAEIPLREGATRQPTFYNRHGDWFGWTCTGISCVAIGVAWLRSRARVEA